MPLTESEIAAPRPFASAVLLDNAPDETRQLIEAVRAILLDRGEIPSERNLAEQLKVTRHRLREALEILRERGEIEQARAGRPRRSGPGGGEAMVRCTNPVEIIELRIVIEPALARLAALRASPFEISRIQRAATTAEGMETGAADLNFHKAVAAGSRNSLAVELYHLLRKVGTDARLQIGRNAPYCPKRLAERDAEHRAIAQAIAARKPEGAEEAMRAHLMVVQQQILRRLAPGG